MSSTATRDTAETTDAPAFGEPIVDYPAKYSRKNGIKVTRQLTTEDGGPFGGITFVTASAKVIDQATGQVVKELDGLEVPDSWGQMSIDIWATKYLRKVDVPQYDADDQLVRDDNGDVVYGSEKSVRQWALRLANAWMLWGRRGGYFATKKDSVAFRDEIAHMIATQMASPNSPQHFNTGIYEAYGPIEDAHGNWYVDPDDGVAKQSPHKYFRSAVNACFINGVADDLVNEGGIFDFFTREARLFKDGSGSGANMSDIRAENEQLSGGGESSGVMSFVRTGDYNAGAIKSGGRTRRAAKMVVLDADHPDIDKFIQCKVDAEKMAAGLIDAGYSAEWNDPDGAYAQVPFQNANHSVGVSHAFMDAVSNGDGYDLVWRKTGQVARTIDANTLMDDIAEAAWICADPGMQFNGTMNDWHTGANDGPIRGTNPCSEYIYLDDTACNLASLNLVKFEADGAGTFNADLYAHAVRLWTIVLEISVSMAHYPSKILAENSYEHRTLGLGYANVGALLMRAGLPYDSDTGRAVLAAVTALMHFGAGVTSAELADAVGACTAYGRNVEPIGRVLRNHVRAAFGPDRDAADLGDYEDLTVLPQELDPTALELAGYGDLLQPVRDLALASLKGLDGNGYRNMQWTVLAPTGTIGLQMGCDTTGIEPGFMLKMWKKLAGGGSMEIVNESVPVALRQLGYTDAQVARIVEHVAETGRIEDAPDLDAKHLPVFDTANRNGGGVRFLSGEAHVRATAAAQPFLSGGISKTINLPADATVADVRYAYELAYRLGVKCTSIYRDKSKRSQVLSDAGVDTAPAAQDAGKLTELLAAADDIPVGTSPAQFYGDLRPLKFRMERSRAARTHHIEIGGEDVFVTFGEYRDGTIGEVFIKTAKNGTYVNSLYELFAMAVSIGLQHGVPLAEFVSKFTGHQFEPSGVIVGHPNLKMAKSPVDAAFRIAGFEALGRDDMVQVANRDTIPATGPVPAATAATAVPAEEADPDDESLSDCCNAPKVQTGTCAVCTSCGTSEGCS